MDYNFNNEYIAKSLLSLIQEETDRIVSLGLADRDMFKKITIDKISKNADKSSLLDLLSTIHKNLSLVQLPGDFENLPDKVVEIVVEPAENNEELEDNEEDPEVDSESEENEDEEEDFECPMPGRKERSKGKGRGEAAGKGKGPIGIPIGDKEVESSVIIDSLEKVAYNLGKRGEHESAYLIERAIESYREGIDKTAISWWEQLFESAEGTTYRLRQKLEDLDPGEAASFVNKWRTYISQISQALEYPSGKIDEATIKNKMNQLQSAGKKIRQILQDWRIAARRLGDWSISDDPQDFIEAVQEVGTVINTEYKYWQQQAREKAMQGAREKLERQEKVTETNEKEISVEEETDESASSVGKKKTQYTAGPKIRRFQMWYNQTIKDTPYAKERLEADGIYGPRTQAAAAQVNKSGGAKAFAEQMQSYREAEITYESPQESIKPELEEYARRLLVRDLVGKDRWDTISVKARSYFFKYTKIILDEALDAARETNRPVEEQMPFLKNYLKRMMSTELSERDISAIIRKYR